MTQGLYTELCEDDSFQGIQRTISNKVSQIWTQLLESASDWKHYLDILRVNPRMFFDTYQKQQPTIETIVSDANWLDFQ